MDAPDELLRSESLDGTDEPWVALSGFLEQEDIESRRRIFGFLHAVFVERDSEQKLKDALDSQRHLGNFWALRLPEAYYVFAGEMTWSACARLGLPGGDLRQLYTEAVRGADEEDEVAIELPAHHYGWESYHSVTNEAGGYPVPAVTLAESFDLRVMPASLDWCDPQGHRASMTLAPPSNFKEAGHLLYLREDLIRDYCARHNYELVWIVWGERDVWFAGLLEGPSGLAESRVYGLLERVASDRLTRRSGVRLNSLAPIEVARGRCLCADSTVRHQAAGGGRRSGLDPTGSCRGGPEDLQAARYRMGNRSNGHRDSHTRWTRLEGSCQPQQPHPSPIGSPMP